MDKRIEIKTIATIDYNDFDDIVEEVYGQKYEFAPDEEMNNGSTKSYNMKKKELDEWDIESLKEFKQTGKFQYLSSVLVQDLVNQDIIPAGDINIEVYW